MLCAGCVRGACMSACVLLVCMDVLVCGMCVVCYVCLLVFLCVCVGGCGCVFVWYVCDIFVWCENVGVLLSVCLYVFCRFVCVCECRFVCVTCVFGFVYVCV